MATKYQIFISSTYEDLKAERDQVIKAVLEMGHIPVGMEMFSAADDEQWKIIARHIEESDYYAVVVAHRYGSVAEEGMSYTRKEYEFARNLGIPTLGFVIESSATWPADQIDMDTETKVLLDDFKDRVKEKPVSFWTSADDLYGKFSVAFMKAMTANPREGWVRASSGVAPQMTSELARLSAENAAMRAEIARANTSAETSRDAELDQVNAQLQALDISLQYRYASGDRSWVRSSPISHAILFDEVAPRLMTEEVIGETSSYLAMFLREDDERRGDIVAMNQVQDLLADWSALDLVEPSKRRHSVSDTGEYWSLTDFGRDALRRARRRRLMTTRVSEVPEPTEAGEG